MPSVVTDVLSVPGVSVIEFAKITLPRSDFWLDGTVSNTGSMRGRGDSTIRLTANAESRIWIVSQPQVERDAQAEMDGVPLVVHHVHAHRNRHGERRAGAADREQERACNDRTVRARARRGTANRLSA